MARLPLSYRLKQVDVADLDSMGSRIEHADALNALEEAIALVTAAEALQQKIQIYTESDDNFDTGELPYLADVMSAARDVVAALKGSHAD